MEPLWRVLPALLVCAAAQHTAEIRAELGRDLTLNCSLNSSNMIYWYMEIHSQIKGCIVNVYENSSKYWVNTSSSKYVAVGMNQLVIKNVTVEDCRLYFCGRRINDSIHFEDTFPVVSNAPVTPSTTDNNQRQLQRVGGLRYDVVMFVSLALNAIAILTALVFICLRLRRKNRKVKVEEPPSSPYENTEMQETPQYEEIQLSPRTSSPAAPPSECIYSKAQLPQPVPP